MKPLQKITFLTTGHSLTLEAPSRMSALNSSEVEFVNIPRLHLASGSLQFLHPGVAVTITDSGIASLGELNKGVSSNYLPKNLTFLHSTFMTNVTWSLFTNETDVIILNSTVPMIVSSSETMDNKVSRELRNAGLVKFRDCRIGLIRRNQHPYDHIAWLVLRRNTVQEIETGAISAKTFGRVRIMENKFGKVHRKARILN
jgi:hypothetical protein